MAYTIKDIAKEAGVSTATVSKVINDKLYVAPETRDKVQAIMKRMNYTPNVSAANLARKSSKMILYADHFRKGLPYENPHMFDIICGVSHELSRKGYHLSLLDLDTSAKEAGSVLEDTIRSRIADGIIINGALVSPQTEKMILRHDFPQICIGAPDFDSILSWIDTNHTLSSSLAVDHLVACGCRRIAFMGGRMEDRIFMDRLKGFRIAMDKHGLEIPEAYVTYNEPTIEAIVSSAKMLLQQSQIPEGIICTNSLMTVGTMQAIKEAGLKIPDEISVIAFDDHPYTPMLSPAPTVIDIDLFSLGVHAGSLLLKKIRDPAMLVQTYTALPRLLQRATTHPING